MIYIYEKPPKGEPINPDQRFVTFKVGKRVPKSEMDKMFAKASTELGIPEEKLVYERLDS